MSDIPGKIYTTPTSTRKYISNPYYAGDKDQVHCKVAEYDFRHQKKNMEKLKDSFHKLGIKMEMVYGSLRSQNKWIRGTEQRYVATFLVTTSRPYLFWHKKESWSAGSGYNLIVIDGERIKTTSWLMMTHEQQAKRLGVPVNTALPTPVVTPLNVKVDKYGLPIAEDKVESESEKDIDVGVESDSE